MCRFHFAFEKYKYLAKTSWLDWLCWLDSLLSSLESSENNLWGWPSGCKAVGPSSRVSWNCMKLSYLIGNIVWNKPIAAPPPNHQKKYNWKKEWQYNCTFARLNRGALQPGPVVLPCVFGRFWWHACGYCKFSKQWLYIWVWQLLAVLEQWMLAVLEQLWW